MVPSVTFIDSISVGPGSSFDKSTGALFCASDEVSCIILSTR